MGNRFKLGHSGKLHSSEVYCDGELMITADVVDLLNEQDVTIKELGKENEQLKQELEKLEKLAFNNGLIGYKVRE